MHHFIVHNATREPWNKGKLVGQKAPLKPKEIWSIRIRLQLANRLPDLALFNLAIDSKVRGCDLVGLRVRDISQGDTILRRSMVMQKKTQRPVQFEFTEQTRDAFDGLDSSCRSFAGTLSIPQPHEQIPTYIDEAILADSKRLDQDHRLGHIAVRNSLDAANESDADLPSNAKPSGSPAAAWAHKAGKHGAVSRH